MLKRNIKITFRLNSEEHQSFINQVKRSGLSQEAFLRTLINGYAPKPLPPPEFFSTLRELHAIGNNLNQLAAKANAIGHIDKTVFQYEANRLRRMVQEIHTAVTAPERRNEIGDDRNLECNRSP